MDEGLVCESVGGLAFSVASLRGRIIYVNLVDGQLIWQ